MADPVYELNADHLRVKLDPASRILGVAGSFVVPYSTVAQAEVVEPKVPGIFDQWLHGLHLPGKVARGRFIGWKGRRRFLWFDAKTTRALRLELRGHPAYDEVLVDIPDPDAALKRIEAARHATRVDGTGHARD